MSPFPASRRTPFGLPALPSKRRRSLLRRDHLDRRVRRAVRAQPGGLREDVVEVGCREHSLSSELFGRGPIIEDDVQAV